MKKVERCSRQRVLPNEYVKGLAHTNGIESVWAG